MWNRVCPLCFARVPGTLVLTEEELACPSCHAPLELSRASRVLSATIGLAGGFLAGHLVFYTTVRGRWFLPLLAAISVFAFASAMMLFFLSDLVVVPKPPAFHFPHSHR